jgi:hypothetical protein
MKAVFSMKALRCAVAVTALWSAAAAQAAAPEANAMSGKKLLYVMNTSKGEFNTKSRLPPTPEQLKHAQARKADDDKQIAFLKSLGFVVFETDDQASVSKAEGMDVIVIAESIRGQAIMDRYKNVTIPVVVHDPDLFDDMGMTGRAINVDFGTDTPVRYIDMINAPHPLSAGLTGTISVFSAGNFEVNWGLPANGAIYIAHLHGYLGKWPIFAYEKGATMYGDFVAPARRVAFFIFEDMFHEVSPDALALYAAAMKWAVTKPDPYTPARTGEFHEHPDLAPPKKSAN